MEGPYQKVALLRTGESCVNGELANEVMEVLLSVDHVLNHFCHHPDFGTPDLLIDRVQALLEKFENRKKI